MFQATKPLGLGRWLALLALCLFSSLARAQSGPTISGVTATSVAASSETIAWNTSAASDSQVEYGATVSYGSVTVRNTVPVTSHSMALIGLSPSTLYHYRVRSRDAAGNLSVSADSSFTTPLAGPGHTYYVDQSGCSDLFPGSASQPWCTLGHASNVLVPGDTVVVRPGTYSESVTPPSGSATAYITYQGLPGAILNGNGTAVNGQAFNIGSQSYLIIMGFEVTNYKNPRPAGNSVDIYGTAHDIELSNLTVHDNWNGIIMSDNANQITINDCLVYNSRYGVGFENTVNNVFISRVTSHSNSETYIGPVSSYVNGDGFSDDAGTADIFIQDGVAYNNSDGGFDFKAATFECKNCIAHDNRYGFRIWGPGPYTLINSLGYGNGMTPLQTQSTGTTYLYNSTFVSHSGDEGYVMEGPGQSLVMRNCILYGYTTQVVSGGGFASLDEDYNLYFSNQGAIGYSVGPHSVVLDPKFVNAAGNDYHLQSTSPAIDAGVALAFIPDDLDDNLRPQGPAYDIGAYEFTGTALQRPNPPTALTLVSVQ